MKDFFSKLKGLNKTILVCIVILVGGLVIISFYLSKDYRINKSALISKAVQINTPLATDTPEDNLPERHILYWSNAVIDTDGTTYFVRRNMGKAGCEINSASKKIPDYCKSSPATDQDLEWCGSERNPSVGTICELVAWHPDGNQEFITDLIKLVPSKYNDLTVDILGFYRPGVLLIRYGNPWPHLDWYGVFTYDISNRLRSDKSLATWYGGEYNEWSVLEKDDYKLIFHPWIYDQTETWFNEVGIKDIGIYLVDNEKVMKINFPGQYSLSQEAPMVQMVVADNWKPSSSISFCVGKDKWSFNFKTKLFSFLTTKDQFCERLD